MTDPNEILKMNLEQLVEAYLNAGTEEEQIIAEKVALREAMLPLIPDDGTDVLNHTVAVSKTKRGKLEIPKTAKEKREAMEKLKEIGLIKLVEKPDEDLAEQMFNKGIKLPVNFVYTEYPVVRTIK